MKLRSARLSRNVHSATYMYNTFVEHEHDIDEAATVRRYALGHMCYVPTVQYVLHSTCDMHHFF